MTTTSAADLLREARRRSGLSQRALARRSGTVQSAVARIESGRASPSWDTLQRLSRAAGFELRAGLHPTFDGRSHMLDDVPRILALPPQQRLLELRNASRLFTAAKLLPDADGVRP